MNLAKLYLANRLFFYVKGQFYRIEEQRFVSVNENEFISATLPVLVLAREHLKETKKRYPVTDKADLKEILKSDSSEYSVLFSESEEENQTSVKFWHADSEILNRYSQKLFFWLPETLLHDALSEGRLWKIHRCGREIFSINDKQHNYSASCNGPFASADYFLMSVGLSQSNINEVTEQTYASQLMDAVTTLSGSKFRALLQSQYLPKKVAQSFDWISIGIGAVVGTLLYVGSQYVYLNNKITSLESDIAALDVKSYVQQKQDILEKRKAFEVFANQDVQQPVEFQLWHFLGLIMKEGVGIHSIRDTENGIWLRLEAKVATESLTKIRSLPLVESASLVNAVQNVRGSQRFNLEVKFKSVEAAKNEVTGNE